MTVDSIRPVITGLLTTRGLSGRHRPPRESRRRSRYQWSTRCFFWDSLIELADSVNLRAQIDAMFRRDKINTTENRSVLHVALRQPAGAKVGGADIEKTVMTERERMLGFAESFRTGRIAGSSKKPFRLVVNIGIGGSDLGTAMGVLALEEFTQDGPACEFVSNIDGCHLIDLLKTADPETTLFIVASKTFTTLETQTNARTAHAWLKDKLGDKAIPSHFAAVSVNNRAMDEFGVHPDYRFDMWDWVSGRYSMWSSIGVALAIAIGRDHFLAFLASGHEMAVLPYDDRLKRFSAYFQQLEMESNGKSLVKDGRPVESETAAVIWGEPGDNARHSFFQLLHQATRRAALDFLVPAESSCHNQDHQNLAIANCVAQAEAFLNGQSAETVRADLERQNLSSERLEPLIPQKVHQGSRPSTIVLF